MQTENQPIIVQPPETVQVTQISPAKSGLPWKKIVLMILVFALFTSGVVYAGWKLLADKPVIEEVSFSPTITTESGQSVPLTYKDDYGFSLRYPVELQGLFEKEDFHVSIRLKQDIIDEIDGFRKGDGCPATCGEFVDDPKLLPKQFELLEKVANLPQCTITPELISEIENSFILFSSGINTKLEASSLSTDRGLCLLKIIDRDGFDADLSNYYYKAGYLSGDYVIQIWASIFPVNGIKKVEALWSSFGFDYTGGSCGSSCYTKALEYHDKVTLDDPLLKEVVALYDQTVKTAILP